MKDKFDSLNTIRGIIYYSFSEGDCEEKDFFVDVKKTPP